MQWHYVKEGQQFGPVDFAELGNLVRQGLITPADLVWHPDFGDKWQPVSSVEKLFEFIPLSDSVPATVPPATAFDGGGTTHNRDLMRMARESLASRWGLAIGIMFLYWVVGIAVGLVPIAGPIAQHIVAGALMLGLSIVFLNIARRTNVEVAQLFEGFQHFATALAAYLLMALFILLWSLLLIIPGVIATLSYAMTYYVIADEPDISALDAIRRSKEMMRGNKWKLFCLYFRFMGWIVLCILTLGVGFIWLIPYMNTTAAHFYGDIRRSG